MEQETFWAVSTIGVIALIGVLIQMKKGFGPFNLRVLGIVLVATFTSLLSLQGDMALTAAMGILGAIAGYLFGMSGSRS